MKNAYEIRAFVEGLFLGLSKSEYFRLETQAEGILKNILDFIGEEEYEDEDE